jgi:2-polyprenyl-3-methyl-5-hydroxy-6-metoxy-1,4-benzoquinol methylase
MEKREILDILKHNQGFDNPEEWIDYARKYQFKKVRAERKAECPDCGDTKFRVIGQYVYYSQLIRLKRCWTCRLRYSDVAIDKSVIAAHFEMTYKDRRYFLTKRRAIFEHVASVVSRLLPRGAAIMDVGGALGHLAARLCELNRDYKLSVSDISEKACEDVAERLGIQTVCCSLEDLSQSNVKVDGLLLIDVLYYVNDIAGAWRSIWDSLSEGGYLVLRLPNKIWRTEFVQFMGSIFARNHQASQIHAFNSEHIYSFSRTYLNRKLDALGFESVQFLPTQLRRTGNRLVDLALGAIFWLARVIHFITFGRLILTPAMLVVAKRR